MTQELPDNASLSDPNETSGHAWRLGRFPNLMPRRIQEILLVSSPYDSFMLEEDGLLTEVIYHEYSDLGLTHAPTVTRVATGEEALQALRSRNFDLVITMLRLGDMNVRNFAAAVRQSKPRLPIVLLITSDWELGRAELSAAELGLDGVFVWHGDTKLFLAIIKILEDRWNAEHDTRLGDVGVIILLDDSVRFRSSLIPLMYTELVKQTRSVMADGINRMHKLLRLRARPKLLLAESFEEGIEAFERYNAHLFGVIVDVSFPRGGELDPRAGIVFIREIKQRLPDLPALLQSSDPANRVLAEQSGANFLHKYSPTLLEDLRRFMLDNFGFGDFVFRLPDGREVARAADLREMERVLAMVPAESLEYHASRNHFSNWLRARTEFTLARRLRPQTIADYGDLEGLRRGLQKAFAEAIWRNRRGVVEDFARQRFDVGSRFARIGGGSLGGKARGLAFVDALLAGAGLERLGDVRITVPRSVVIGTDVFDRFLDENHLRLSALRSASDDWLRWAFLTAKLPDHVVGDLRAFLETVRDPIAVRSSSLLEDSQYHPFAGVYQTIMLPNNDPDERVRMVQLCDALKLVYASTFYASARNYLKATPYRIEEEKMAVILQPIVGRRHESYFYPSFAGVARSYNFYPYGHMRPEEGVASVALGLGKFVAEGGPALRFCPAHPHVLPQLALGEKFINASQREFYAIDLHYRDPGPGAERYETIVALELEDAERHGTLAPLGSSWSRENQALYDGIERAGVRVVTFAHILKSEVFPLAAILGRLLELGRSGMNRPVEIEFAATLDSDPPEFAVLQIRPSYGGLEGENVELGNYGADEVLCYSARALGNGVFRELRDVVYVRPDNFDPLATRAMAEQIGQINAELLSTERHSVLLGPGRWGSTNPTLGIPVNWTQICAARVIVETTLHNFLVDPSQGSHFFQNLTSCGIAYMTVIPNADEGLIDWDWLAAQPAVFETEFVRHVRVADPLEARIDGHVSRGVVLKSSRRRGQMAGEALAEAAGGW